ncbi:hypothetical protein CDCA_CDCA11G3281 [Cyanidium caldarium]|uniref:SAC domain-containing protein n=1 Tax=Cyanidium caldarium TaxID=2771 RepID=A0AAV9IYN8_CYACA|nr:hypothetical protein CDCA_CDCA11G3281 [Cyanidium caldarium]
MAGGDEVRCVASGEWLVLATSTKSPAEWGLVAVWERGSGRLHAAPTDDRAEVAWKAGRVLLAARPGEEAYRAVIYDGLACGLAGSVTLLLNEYLLVIAQRRRVGRAWGDDAIRLGVGDIYKAVRFDVLPLRRVRAAEADASWVERRAERRLRRSLRRVLACDGFYFSPTLDLTRPLQDALPDVGSAPRYRTDFVWNHALLTHLTRVSVDDSAERSALLPLSIPLVFGFVDHCTAPCRTVDGASATLHYLLVSRRQRHRAGLRYIDRGADVHGHVANFVETESVLICGRRVASLLQLRGSIPLHWQQQTSMAYKPLAQLLGTAEQHRLAFTRHFQVLHQRYGQPIVAVDLVDQRGHELTLQQAYAAEADACNIPYIAWDFHRQCRGMRYERVQSLVEMLQGQLAAQGLFVYDGGTRRVLQRQVGAVRTNCMDCLDRTNVVQSAIARAALERQWPAVGVAELEAPTAFAARLQHAWADHADALALFYAGSGALKTDTTRVGRRTTAGMALDGWRAARRYVCNTFCDGRRQDAIDLFLGQVRLTPSGIVRQLAVRDRRDRRLGLLVVFCLLACSLTLWGLMHRHIALMAAGVASGVLAYRLARHSGRTLVDTPCLTTLHENDRWHDAANDNTAPGDQNTDL